MNASGWSLAGPALFLKTKNFDAMPWRRALVTVPSVDGWAMLLDRFGRKNLSQVLAAATAIAGDGCPVAEITAAHWAHLEQFLREDPGATRTFLPGGRPPVLGEMFRNPSLAWTYAQIAERGRDGFYRGEVARRVLTCLNGYGGTMRPEDLEEFHAEWVAPISTTYRGWEVFEIPPNGAGIAALMMLNILEPFPLSEYGYQSVDALHTLIEAKKLAYADMERYVSDPRCSAVPVDAMLAKPFARARAASIDPARARASVAAADLPAHAGDTTYLSVVDRDGNLVSLIQSNFAGFGSGLVPEGTGFALQNRGALFTLDPAHPNTLAPRKRPLHTIIPAFMQKDGAQIGFGIMGGWNQSQAHAQFVSNIADYGMTLQQALEAALHKLTFDGCDVIVEGRIPEPVRAGLSAKGHELDVQGDFSSFVGGGQAVMRKGGVNYGASDPRKDGSAIPEPV